MAIMKTLTVNGVTYEVTSSVPVTSVTLLASAWVGEGRRYSQEVLVPGSTAKSQVNLTPTDEQLDVFYDKDLTFSTVNKGGTVTATVIGQRPENDYTIPVNIVEVITDDEEIHGIPVATPINPDKFAAKDAVKTVNGIAPDENGNVVVSGGLVVTVTGTTVSHSSAEIAAHVKAGSNVVLKQSYNWYNFLSYDADVDAADFIRVDAMDAEFFAMAQVSGNRVSFYKMPFALDNEVVKSVNGIAPDENGNVEVAGGSGGNVDLTGYATEQYVQNYAQPKGNYLTEHQDISGKLDASALPTAINTALAQAKASGEFDGADGKDGQDGYTPQKNVDYFDGKDGSNGADGKPGRGIDHIEDPGDGTIEIYYTDTVDADGIDIIKLPKPVRGTDYWTEADKQEIAEQAAELVEIPDSAGYVVQDTEPTDTSVLWVDTSDDGNDGFQEAVNMALAQAKASGDFDGADGRDGTDGYTPQKGIDYFDGKDGTNGKTPVKGTDYFTAADKAEMVNAVIAALPVYAGEVV